MPPKPPPNDHDAGNRLRHKSVLPGKRWGGRFDLLHPEFHELQKNLIPHLSQFIYRATVRHFGDTDCDCLLAALGPFREDAKILPPHRDRAGKVLHEVLNASLATAQMEEHT